MNGKTKCNISSRECQINDKTMSITLKFNNKKINSTENMFRKLNITEIDLSNFDASEITNMHNMFYSCKELKKINFGNVGASLVRSVGGLFASCYELECVGVSNLVTNIKKMFFCCHILKSITLPKIFNTSLVESMEQMFYHCYVLKSIDLSIFDTSKVTDMSSMFYNCRKIKYLNLSSFNTSKVETISQMFYGCKSLHYLNIKQFTLNEFVNKTEAFNTTSNAIRYCINDINQGINLLNSDKSIICSDTCIDETNIKIHKIHNICLKICEEGTYDYNNFCIGECPEGYHIQKNKSNICESDKCQAFPNNMNICIENIPEGYYFDKNDGYYKKCHNNCIYCYAPGNETNNNCKECKPDLKLFNVYKDIKIICFCIFIICFIFIINLTYFFYFIIKCTFWTFIITKFCIKFIFINKIIFTFINAFHFR